MLLKLNDIIGLPRSKYDYRTATLQLQKSVCIKVQEMLAFWKILHSY